MTGELRSALVPDNGSLQKRRGARTAGRRQQGWPLIFLLPLLAMVLAGCAEKTGSTWRRIRQEGVLRVGLDPTYPPFETAENGQLRGIDVDLARALAGELDLEATFVYFGYDGLYDALATEQVDTLMSALVVRVEQTKDFAYSEPYFNAGQVLVVDQEEERIAAMSDLEGRTLAVELGAQGHVVATQWDRRLPNLTIEPHDGPAQALDAVAQDRADAALVDAISGRLYLAQNEEVKQVGDAVTVEPFAIVVRKEDEKLLEEINRALASLEENGQLHDIVERWMARIEP